MDVRPGYKMTEVGVIPEDWEIKSLGDIARIQRGASPRPIDSPIWFDENSSIGWVRISDVTRSRLTLKETAQALSFKGVSKSRFVKRGSLIMSICATVGHPIITGIDVCIHDGFVVFNDPISSLVYLFYTLKNIENSWSKAGQTGSQMNLNTGIINPKKIPLPPLREQQAIATALSDVDTLITKLDQLIAKKRDIKQATMQRLLTGQTRLPGFNGAWEVKRLGDIIERFVGGGTPSRSNKSYWNGNVPWVTVKDFSTFNSTESQEYITISGLRNSASNLISSGVVILSTRMAVGAAVMYGIDVAINQDLKALFPSHILRGEFLYFWFQNNAEMLSSLGSGSTVKGISLVDLKKLLFNLPPLPEQQAIATILSDMDAEITALESRRKKTRALKQGMMQELLTGRIRLIPPAAHAVSA